MIGAVLGAVAGAVGGAGMSPRSGRTKGAIVGGLVGVAAGALADQLMGASEAAILAPPAPYQSMVSLNGKPCGSALAAAGLCVKPGGG